MKNRLTSYSQLAITSEETVKIKFYPGGEGSDSGGGPVRRFLKELSKKKPDLFSLVNSTLIEAATLTSLKKYEDNDYVARLGSVKYPLYEFRIPPRNRKGVVRMYFGYISMIKKLL